MEFGNDTTDITGLLPAPTCYGLVAGKVGNTGVTDFGLNIIKWRGGKCPIFI